MKNCKSSDKRKSHGKRKKPNCKRNWMHVTSTKHLTHYQVHAKRGTAALDDNGILPVSQGTSVHDGWTVYEGYGCQHALCNVHLLRDLIFVEETTQQPLARQMQTVLLDLAVPIA